MERKYPGQRIIFNRWGVRKMLGDETREIALKATYSGLEISAGAVTELINKLLEEKGVKFGQQSLKSLNRKGVALESIPVASQDLRGLRSELKKYGVDFSVRKNLSEKNTYDLYFKGRDVVQIEAALKNYAANNIARYQEGRKNSIKQRIQEAARKAQQYNRQRQDQQRESPEFIRTKAYEER